MMTNKFFQCSITICWFSRVIPNLSLKRYNFDTYFDISFLVFHTDFTCFLFLLGSCKYKLSIQGGNYFLTIPASVWIILRDNGGFKGIKFVQDPTTNPDGSYTVKLTPDQWETFQVNQKTLMLSQPAAPAPEEADPVRYIQLDITTRQDPSMSQWNQ